MQRKNVLIIGGSRGIGAATVRLFASLGYAVAFTYCASDAAASALAEETGALAIKADSASYSEIDRAIDVFHSALGSVDILVANAAVSEIGLFTDLTEDTWAHLRAVNLDGPMYYVKRLLPDMIAKKWGRVLLISSMWGQVGASCEVPYSTAKAGLIGLTRALAKEVGPSGITVNCIAPGLIDTEMNAALSPRDLDALCEEIPLGRLGTAEEVAALALFLSGEGGSYITGQVIAPNGGMVI